MEQQEILDLEWLPEQLEGIFEDSHADHHSRWESLQGPTGGDQAA